jgi:hypothetical protein
VHRRDVQHQAGPGRPAGVAVPAGPRGDRHAEPGRERQALPDVGGLGAVRHGGRPDPVVPRAEQPARPGVVGVAGAHQPAGQPLPERRPLRRGRGPRRPRAPGRRAGRAGRGRRAARRGGAARPTSRLTGRLAGRRRAAGAPGHPGPGGQRGGSEERPAVRHVVTPTRSRPAVAGVDAEPAIPVGRTGWRVRGAAVHNAHQHG